MKNSKILKAYNFFKSVEENNFSFSLQDICEATGWKISTVNSYRTKKWHYFLIPSDDKFKCRNFINQTTLENFITLHQQHIEIYPELLRPKHTIEVDTLIDKAREASWLAIQIFNNPLAKFRSSGFIVNMIIAYTALFQAVFERDKVEYWYKNNDEIIYIDGDKKYWELDKCLEEYFNHQQSPEKENIKLFLKLRDKIEHRFFPAIDLRLSGYCQALVLNFEVILAKEFGTFFTLGDHIFLAVQISGFREETFKSLSHIQAQHHDQVTEYIRSYCDDLPQSITQNEKFCFRAFVIPKLANHANSADIALEYVKFDENNPEEMDIYNKQVALIKQKLVQVADQGKLRPTEVVRLVQERTGIHFNIYLHSKAWKKYGVRMREKAPDHCNSKYCQFSEPFHEYIYTQAWVDFLCEKISQPEEYQALRKYK